MGRRRRRARRLRPHRARGRGRRRAHPTWAPGAAHRARARRARAHDPRPEGDRRRSEALMGSAQCKRTTRWSRPQDLLVGARCHTDPADLARLPDHVFHRANVEARRAGGIAIRAARRDTPLRSRPRRPPARRLARAARGHPRHRTVDDRRGDVHRGRRRRCRERRRLPPAQHRRVAPRGRASSRRRPHARASSPLRRAPRPCRSPPRRPRRRPPPRPPPPTPLPRRGFESCFEANGLAPSARHCLRERDMRTTALGLATLEVNAHGFSFCQIRLEISPWWRRRWG